MIWKGISLAVAATIVSVLVMVFSPFSGVREVAHESTELHLRLIGSSICEYHSTTGKWPAKIEDLGKTSLPLQSPYWKQMLDDEVYIIVWHNTLKPDPNDNVGQILVYHNKGLIATMGRSWVCWGDLRTEYMKTEDLRIYLQNLKD